MSRSIKPWCGKTDDAMPPPRVRLRIFLAHDGKCAITGREITPQDKWDLDHAKALIDGGTNDEANLRPVLREAHRVKTAQEVQRKSRVDARAKSHAGIKGVRTALSGPDRAEKREIREARSKNQRGDRLPTPSRRIWPGFESAGSARR